MINLRRAPVKLIARCLFAIVVFTSMMLATAGPASATRRALLIGISNYEHIPPLDNPLIDVENIGEKLAASQYLVTAIKDPETTRPKLLIAIDKFIKTIKQGDEVVVYYSGHGVDVRGNNMLVPADSPSIQDVYSEFALSQQLVPMRDLMIQIEDHQPAIQVWIIDACRENPYSAGGRPFAASGGLRKFDERPNSFIFFAANYSQTALDKLPGEAPRSGLGSPFSRTFAKLFDRWKNKNINDYATQVRREVVQLVSPNPQFPVFEHGLLEEWCFVTCSALGSNKTPNGPGPEFVHAELDGRTIDGCIRSSEFSGQAGMECTRPAQKIIADAFCREAGYAYSKRFEAENTGEFQASWKLHRERTPEGHQKEQWVEDNTGGYIFSVIECGPNMYQQSVSLTFVNKTDGLADVFWIRPDGSEILYSKMQPGASYGVSTYSGHNWIVRTSGGGELARYTAGEDGGTSVVDIYERR